MKGLEGRTVIVTGGAGGIGAAACKRITEAGAQVAVFDMNVEPDPESDVYRVDITDYQQVEAAVDGVLEKHGSIEGLVNNAGWDLFKPFVATSPDEWQKVVNINLMGMLNMHHLVIPKMTAQKYGRVVNVASDAARVGSSGEAVYAACKGGMVAFTKTLAREHVRDGITFNVVCPGPTETPLLQSVIDGAGNPEKLEAAFTRAVPMGRLGQPEDLAGVITFLLSDEVAYMTGQVISVSGGLTMAG